MASAVRVALQARGIGVSYCVSTGNGVRVTREAYTPFLRRRGSRPGRYSMLCSVPSVIVRAGCILVYVPGRPGAGQEHDSRHGKKTRATFKKHA